jgi:hypothetical protein
MTFHFDTLPPAPFVGGPACGAGFDGYGITTFPRELRIPHRGRLYRYTLHFRRKQKRTLFSYRFKGVFLDSVSQE